MLVFWHFKNMCLSFTFNFPPHLVLIVLTATYLSSLFIKNSFCMRSGKSPYTNEVMIPLNMFFFMTCRSCWLSVLFHEDFCCVLHNTEVSGAGSNISICLACFLQTELHHSQFIHCDRQQLEHRKQAPDQRSFLVVMDGKLKQQLDFYSYSFT